MKVAIMQPYFCPYIGYFQMVGAVDTFVFYDDVNYIKRGWINRNNILSNGQPFLFSVPVIDASQNKLIKDVMVNWESKDIVKLQSNILHSYRKAPYFDKVSPIVDAIFSSNAASIADLAIESVVRFSDYLGLTTRFKRSSEIEYVKTTDRAVNLSNIVKLEGSLEYINAIGGQELYTKEEFARLGVDLKFIQGGSSLSILHECMMQPVELINDTLKNYALI